MASRCDRCKADYRRYQKEESDFLSLVVEALIEGDLCLSESSDDERGAKQVGSRSRGLSGRLRPVEEFLSSDLAKRVRDRLEKAKREREADSKESDGGDAKGGSAELPPKDRVEGLVDGLIDGSILVESLGLLDPGKPNKDVASDRNSPALDEYFNSLVLRINGLDLLEYYLTSSLEDDLDAILLFFDSEMEKDKASQLLNSFRDVLPGTQVVQMPEDGCWVFLAIKDEVDVLGTGGSDDDSDESQEAPEEAPDAQSGGGGVFGQVDSGMGSGGLGGAPGDKSPPGVGAPQGEGEVKEPPPDEIEKTDLDQGGQVVSAGDQPAEEEEPEREGAPEEEESPEEEEEVPEEEESPEEEEEVPEEEESPEEEEEKPEKMKRESVDSVIRDGLIERLLGL